MNGIDWNSWLPKDDTCRSLRIYSLIHSRRISSPSRRRMSEGIEGKKWFLKNVSLYYVCMPTHAKQSKTTCDSRKLCILSSIYGYLLSLALLNILPPPSPLQFLNFLVFFHFLPCSSDKAGLLFFLGLGAKVKYTAIQRAKWCDIKPSSCSRQVYIDGPDVKFTYDKGNTNWNTNT